jgi:hypothetical protein
MNFDCSGCNSNAKLIEQVVAMKQANPNIGRKAIANKLSCPVNFVRTVLAKIKSGELDATTALANVDSTESDLRIRKLRRVARIDKKKYEEALRTIEELNHNIDQARQLEDLKQIIVPTKYEVHPADPGEAVAVAVASDWHIDEVVDGSAINYVNEFNLDIARKRVKKFFEFTLRLLNMCRTESKINTMVVAALGDFMSGWIHEELIASNSMTPPESIMEMFEMWCGGLTFLLEEGELEELVFVGVTGNHSRITKRIHAKANPKKSYEWPLYEFLARWFSNTKYRDRIRFKLPTGYMNYLDIVGKKVRFHHGDGINYHGGVGGIHIPLRKAIAQWNKGNPVDLDVLGHWHTRETSRNYVINGSLIGFNEYAEKIKADFEPPTQSFFILHPKYGKTAEFPIVLP